MKANGLTLHGIKSEARPVVFRDDLPGMISEHLRDDKAFVAAYLDYKVLFGRFENKVFAYYGNDTVEPRFIQRLRVFNRRQELLIWRSYDGLKARLRTDEQGEDTEVVEAEQVLYGTNAEHIGNFTKLTEDRGTELILPFSGLNVNDKKDRICVSTRNYIGYNEAHQATYVDCRFLGFSQNGKALE